MRCVEEQGNDRRGGGREKRERRKAKRRAEPNVYFVLDEGGGMECEKEKQKQMKEIKKKQSKKCAFHLFTSLSLCN